MKIVRLFTLLSLVVFLTVQIAEVQAQSPTPDPSDIPAAEGTAPTTGSGTSDTAAPEATATTPTPVPFASRLDSLKSSEAGDGKVTPTALNNACFPQSQFKAYGFYALSENAGEVNFGVYSRIQYYSLTPQWDGNIETPLAWVGAEATEAVHRHGGKVDLVISNREWFFENGTENDESYDYFEGLWLTKSYVLSTLIDDTVDAVNDHNFDGVTIDFRLPRDVDTILSYTFLVNRLKKRLEEDTPGSSENDLLKPESKKLNLVIDRAFAENLAANYYIREVRNEILMDDSYAAKSKKVVESLSAADWEKIIENPADPGVAILESLPEEDLKKIKARPPAIFNDNIIENINPALESTLLEFSSSVDFLFVDEEIESAVETALKNQSANRETLIVIPIISNEEQATKQPAVNQFNANQIKGNSVGIWDVAGGGMLWQTSEGRTGLESRVFGSGPNLQNGISQLVCTSRGKIANALTGLTPLLALLVLVSWVFYDFPFRFKRSTSNLVIWGLLAISFVALILLLIGLPSINFGNIQLYIIVSAFIIPLLYLIWTFSTKVGEQNYP